MNDETTAMVPFRPGWTEALLRWYRSRRRDLPWRDDPDPYRILVSEIMGQQTRMSVLVPYFERFVQRLPSVADLAAVDDDVLFKLWEGLGYYRRAVNLKKAAVLVMERHGGVIPDTREGLLALPGVGAYTAGAILSIAFGVFEPAIDGNVRRVIARQFGIDQSPESAEGSASIESIVRRHAPAGESADYTQALMELGALVCLPNGAPLCDSCPGRDGCVARRDDRIGELPVRAAKKARRIEPMTILAIRTDDGSILFERRPAGGLLAGMRGLHAIPGTLSIDELTRYCEHRGISVESIVKLASRKHVFTHVEWHMTGYLATVRGPLPSQAGETFTPAEIVSGVAVASAFQGFLAEILRLPQAS